jgi:molybdopterin converting factor small subunit
VSRVRIPPVLRIATGGNKDVVADGGTLRELIGSLGKAYPDLDGKLLQADGSISRYLNVYVNDQDVRLLHGLETEVKEQDTVTILPAMSGGAARLTRRLRR